MTTQPQQTAATPEARPCLWCGAPVDPLAARTYGRVCSRACAREWLDEEGDQ